VPASTSHGRIGAFASLKFVCMALPPGSTSTVLLT
jgi:hypothetical protein